MRENTYKPPKANLGEEPSQPSRLPGLFLFLTPSLFLLFSFIISIALNYTSRHTRIPDYKLWAYGLSAFAASPVCYVMNCLAWHSSAWHSRSFFWLTALLGGIVWSMAFALIVQVVYLAMIEFMGPSDAITLTIFAKIRFAFIHSPGPSIAFGIFLVPIHFLYSIRRRKNHQCTSGAA